MMIKPRRVEAGRGIAWLGEGWRLFRVDPGMWIVLTLVGGLMLLVPSLLPPIGPLLFALLVPGLAGGLLHAGREAAEGRPLELRHLVVAYRQVERRNPMLVLGAFNVVAHLLMSVIAMVLMGGSVGLGGILGGGNQGMLMAGVGMGLLLAWLIDSLFLLLWAMALLYAIPLVMFAGIAPVAALRRSLDACIVNALPLLVIGVLWLLLALLAALPALLGFLVLIPVTAGSVYASYRDLFPPPTVRQEP